MDDRLSLADELIERLEDHVTVHDMPTAKQEVHDVLTHYEVSVRPYTDGQSMEGLIDAYIAARRIDGLSSRTLTDYRQQLQLFNRHVQKDASHIRTPDIRAYIAYLMDSKRVKDNTLATRIHILRGFFTWLYCEEIITRNPTDKIKAPICTKRGLRKPLTADELEQLRFACQTVRERAVVEFFYSTACRLSEVINVRISDIDFMNRRLTVLGKGNKERIVYFNTCAKIYIMEYLKSRPDKSDYLFICSKSPYNRMGCRSIQRTFIELADRAGIRHVHPHLMRHTYATNAINAGMDTAVLQRILGHTNFDTTLIYANVSQSNVQFQYDKFSM